MALTTFGAIMGFAAGMVKEAEETYKALAEKAKDSGLKEVLEALSVEEGKNHALMVKTRRENVTEMILEPVSGLDQGDYELELKGLDTGEDTGILRAALALEERGKKFFYEASAKVPLPEVAKIFRKMVQKKEGALERLQSLGLSKTFERRN